MQIFEAKKAAVVCCTIESNINPIDVMIQSNIEDIVEPGRVFKPFFLYSVNELYCFKYFLLRKGLSK